MKPNQLNKFANLCSMKERHDFYSDNLLGCRTARRVMEGFYFFVMKQAFLHGM
jgi:hypothetical protein